jgi:recombination protein RecR
MPQTPIQNLIDKFARLPSIGPKSAERLVFYLLKSNPKNLEEMAQSLLELKNSIIKCDLCHNYSESNPCPICSDVKRNKQSICIVSKPQDVIVLEKTNAFGGVYFILGGSINSSRDSEEVDARINEFINRIKMTPPQEIILALNPDIDGETTMLYLNKAIKQFPNIKVSRLARGLPIGADLEYADEMTLESALKGRQNM